MKVVVIEIKTSVKEYLDEPYLRYILINLQESDT